MGGFKKGVGDRAASCLHVNVVKSRLIHNLWPSSFHSPNWDRNCPDFTQNFKSFKNVHWTEEKELKKTWKFEEWRRIYLYTNYIRLNITKVNVNLFNNRGISHSLEQCLPSFKLITIGPKIICYPQIIDKPMITNHNNQIHRISSKKSLFQFLLFQKNILW